MNDIQEILLVGNGINRLSKDYSWENLLDELVLDIGKENAIEHRKIKPLTLLYEEIFFRSRRYLDKDEIDLKKKISDLVNKLKPNDFHRKFLNLGTTHILTTNYDYNLEKSAYGKVEKGKSVNLSIERKYNLFRRRQINNKYIWHIHGEAEIPNSITLGHEHYSGYLQKMRNHLTEKNNIHKGNSWVDLFIKSDVHIVGLSLDYTEIDLWWLIIYKERLKLNGKNDSYIGKTIFHHFSKPTDSERNDSAQTAKFSLLESYGVEIRRESVREGEYDKAYNKFIKNFKDRGE